MQSEPLQLLSNDVFQSNSGIKWMHGLTRRECASMPSSDIDLEKLYQEHFSKIYNYFFYQLLHRENAEDLTSCTFLKAAEHISDYNPDKAQISTWLWTIAQNTLIDFYRTQKPELSIDHETIRLTLLFLFRSKNNMIKFQIRREKHSIWLLRSFQNGTGCSFYHKYFWGKLSRHINAVWHQ